MIVYPFSFIKTAGGGGGIDPDAQAFITASGISGTEADAINDLVIELKGTGLWTKMQAVWPFVGSTSSTQKWNLKDPRNLNAAYRLTFEETWTHDASGAHPSGPAWGRTYIAPGTNSFWDGVTASTGGHLSVNVIENAPGNAGYDFGSFGGSNNVEWMIIASFGNSTAYGMMDNGGFVTYSNANTIGFYTVSQNTVLKNYKDAVVKTTTTRNWVRPDGTYQEMAIAASGRAGGGGPDAVAFSNRSINFATIGYSLTDDEVGFLNTAVVNYNDALGR